MNTADIESALVLGVYHEVWRHSLFDGSLAGILTSRFVVNAQSEVRVLFDVGAVYSAAESYLWHMSSFVPFADSYRIKYVLLATRNYLRVASSTYLM